MPNKFPVNGIQNITHITILNALMTAWVGDLLGRDIHGLDLIVEPPSNVFSHVCLEALE